MILIFTFGVMVGVGITGIAGGNRYDKGFYEGRDLGYEIGYKEGYARVNHEAEAYRRIKEKANVVSFRKNGESQ